MTAETVSMNGVIKITKRSLAKFQFGDDNEPVIVLDVIAVSDQWHEIDWSLRVLKEDRWVIPTEKYNEHAQNRYNFVQAIINDAYAAQHSSNMAPTITRAEAEEFITKVDEEVGKLRNFIYAKKDETLSAPESTESDRGTNFSQ